MIYVLRIFDFVNDRYIFHYSAVVFQYISLFFESTGVLLFILFGLFSVLHIEYNRLSVYITIY